MRYIGAFQNRINSYFRRILIQVCTSKPSLLNTMKRHPGRLKTLLLPASLVFKSVGGQENCAYEAVSRELFQNTSATIHSKMACKVT